MFDQKPLGFGRFALRTHQHPRAAQNLAVQYKLQLAAFQIGTCAAFGFPSTVVEDIDVSRTVVAFGDVAGKFCIRQRMIFDLYRQPFYRGIEARAFRDRPAFQRAVQLQPMLSVM